MKELTRTAYNRALKNMSEDRLRQLSDIYYNFLAHPLDDRKVSDMMVLPVARIKRLRQRLIDEHDFRFSRIGMTYWQFDGIDTEQEKPNKGIIEAALVMHRSNQGLYARIMKTWSSTEVL